MCRNPTAIRIVPIAGIALLWAAAGVAAGQLETSPGSDRPVLLARAPAHGCPVVEGAYLALLDPGLGVLLLSAAPFPGGAVVGEADGGAMRLARGPVRTWELAGVGSPSGPVRLWAARWGFRGEPVGGCVAFDKDRFSAEGDLASYVYWLVGSVYSRLPAAERARRPGFRLSDRQVRLRIARQGQGAVDLAGKEGATLACRFPDDERTYLAIPFVLDQLEERVAVQVGFTDSGYWEPGEKTMVAWVVVAPGAPAGVAELGLEVAVLDVAPRTGG